MTWAHPSLFGLLLLVPLAAALVWLGWRARTGALARLAPRDALDAILPPRVHGARWVQGVLAVVAVLALTLAAAGPRLGFDWQQRKVEGVSIAIVLDISRSMDAQDVSPSRLERARREITDLVALLRGDAVGLVVFAAGPFIRVPLTVDYDTLLWAVDDTTTGTIRAQGTSLAGALDAATQLLSRAEGSGKAILVISDGEGHDASTDLDAAVARARDGGLRIYGLGIGEPDGAPIPVEEGGFKKDRRGDLVLTKLDETNLKRLAAETGGAYVRAVVSDADVRALYIDEIRGKLEASERGVRRDKIWRERFQWPLAIGLLALAGAAVLGIGRRGVVTAALLFVLIPEARASSTSEGLDAWRAKDWDKAAELLGQARVEDPGNREVATALADALYRDGRYREAEQLFESLAVSDEENQAIHLYNAGNAAYRGGRLGNALNDYVKALAAKEDFEPAKKNADAVRKEIQARLQKQQEQNQQQDGQQGESQDGQQGEPQDGQPQDGQPQDGQSQDGQPQGGQQQAGQDGNQQTPNGQSQDGQNPAPSDGVREPGEPQVGTRDGADPSAIATDTDTPSEDGSAGQVEPGEEEEMTAEEAARLVDSVQDGKPRVVVGGRDTEKDW